MGLIFKKKKCTSCHWF